MQSKPFFKRFLATGTLVACLLAILPTAVFAASSSVTTVTGYDYAQLIAGGVNDSYVFTAYENGALMMGTLTTDGECSREAYDALGWNELFEAAAWMTEVTGDAGALCPYADTHQSNTLCPYLDYDCVTMTDTSSGVTLAGYYVLSEATRLLPSGTVHICRGRYGFSSPVSLKYDEEQSGSLFALRDANGKWGVYDADSEQLLVPYIYEEMSAVYGDRVKVKHDGVWSQLDVTSGTLRGAYDSEDAFSVTEEVRAVEGGWQVFDEDNTPLSAVFADEGGSVSYAPQTHLLLMTAASGEQTLYDLRQNAVAHFDAQQRVRYLGGDGYAVENRTESGAIIGIALITACGVSPQESVQKGDVDRDGTVSTADARLLLKKLTHGAEWTTLERYIADVDENGALNTGDVRILLWTLMNTEEGNA